MGSWDRDRDSDSGRGRSRYRRSSVFNKVLVIEGLWVTTTDDISALQSLVKKQKKPKFEDEKKGRENQIVNRRRKKETGYE